MDINGPAACQTLWEHLTLAFNLSASISSPSQQWKQYGHRQPKSTNRSGEAVHAVRNSQRRPVRTQHTQNQAVHRTRTVGLSLGVAHRCQRAKSSREAKNALYTTLDSNQLRRPKIKNKTQLLQENITENEKHAAWKWRNEGVRNEK